MLNKSRYIKVIQFRNLLSTTGTFNLIVALEDSASRAKKKKPDDTKNRHWHET